MAIISFAVGLICFLLFCSIYIRIGNTVVELRKLNKQFEEFLKRFKIE